VLWLGLARAEAAAAAAVVLREELGRRGLPVEERPLRPHLTVTRARKPLGVDSRKSIEPLLAHPPTMAPTRATGLALFRSRAGGGQTIYTRLSEARL
jgi:2'-5' RNA ligase